MFAIYKKQLAVNKSPINRADDHVGSEASDGEGEDYSVYEAGSQKDDQMNSDKEAELLRNDDEDDEYDGQQGDSLEDGFFFEEDGEDTDYEGHPNQEALQQLLDQWRDRSQRAERLRQQQEETRQQDSLLRVSSLPATGGDGEEFDVDDEDEESPPGGFSGEPGQNKGRLGRADAGPGTNFGDDHNASSDNRDGEDDDEQVEETLPLTDRLFQKLFKTQGNPVILFGNNLSIKSTFNTASQEFELEFHFTDNSYSEFSIRLDELEEYKSIILQKLFSQQEAEDEDEQKQLQLQQQHLDNLIAQNFNDNLEAPLLKDEDENSIAALIIESIINADPKHYKARLAELELDDNVKKNQDSLIKYYAKMLSPFSATISPTFTREEKDNFLELLRQSDPALTDYLRSLRDHSPAYQNQQAFGLNARITNNILENVFIEQSADDDKLGKVWVEEQVQKIKDQVDQEISNRGNQSSCQQVRILFTENYLTSEEHEDVNNDVPTASAMIIVHVNKFEVTQNVIAKTKEEYDQDFYANYQNMAYGYRAIDNASTCNENQQKLTYKFLADTGLLTGDDFLNELIDKLESSDPNDQNMQGRIAKYFYEMGALSDEGQVDPYDQGIPDEDQELLGNLAQIKLAQDYLDSQINARPDYLRMENSCTQNNISPLHYDDGKFDEEAYKKYLNFFKIHFGDSPQDRQNGEPPFHEGSIKITRAKNNPNLIDIVRVIPTNKNVAKKFHDVQYVAIKDEKGDLVERDLCLSRSGEKIPSKYFFRKVTLSEKGPQIDQKLFYYDEQGKINSVELTNLDQSNEGFNKLCTDLVQMKIRATTVCGNSIESKFSAIDYYRDFDFKFVDEKINPSDYELGEFILKKDKTSSVGNLITEVNCDEINKEFSFQYRGETSYGFDDAVIYAHGAVDEASRQVISEKVAETFEEAPEEFEAELDSPLYNQKTPPPSPSQSPSQSQGIKVNDLQVDRDPGAASPRGVARGGGGGLWA